MILVPRHLQRAGMTGNVPYYGGRLTPAQAWGASHRAPQPVAVPDTARPAHGAPVEGSSTRDAASALESLRESGVLTPEEYDELRRRMPR
jgi:hypothetical protein